MRGHRTRRNIPFPPTPPKHQNSHRLQFFIINCVQEPLSHLTACTPTVLDATLFTFAHWLVSLDVVMQPQCPCIAMTQPHVPHAGAVMGLLAPTPQPRAPHRFRSISGWHVTPTACGGC